MGPRTVCLEALAALTKSPANFRAAVCSPMAGQVEARSACPPRLGSDNSTSSAAGGLGVTPTTFFRCATRSANLAVVYFADRW